MTREQEKNPFQNFGEFFFNVQQDLVFDYCYFEIYLMAFDAVS
jgi:hypothetical protein